MSDSQIIARLDVIQSAVDRLEGQFRGGAEMFALFHDGMDAYAERRLKAANLTAAPVQQIAARALADPSITYPARKILDALLSLYDYRSASFGEMHFSRLVRLARVSKSRAASHLAHLETGGYVEKRTTGYRVFYRIHCARPISGETLKTSNTKGKGRGGGFREDSSA